MKARRALYRDSLAAFGVCVTFLTLGFVQTARASQVDPEYGTDGIAKTTMPDSSRAGEMVQLDSGKTLAIGTREGDDVDCAEFYSARFDGNGVPDLTYGGTGFVFGAVGCEIPSSAVAAPGDRTVIGTESVDTRCASLLRIGSNGDPEAWSGGSPARIKLCDGPDQGQKGNILNDVQRDKAARYVVAGRAQWGGRKSLGYIYRIKANGTRDTSFGNKRGQVRFFPENPGSSFSGVDVVKPSGSELFAAGSFANKTMVVKLRQDGSRARNFGKNGVFTLDLDRNSDCFCTQVFGMARDKQGRVTVAATTHRRDKSGSVSNFQLTLFRVTRAGTLDRSFGNNGTSKLLSGSDFTGGAMTVQSDGRIVVAGSLESSSLFQFTVARFLPGGKLDPSFFGDGTFESVGGDLGGFATDVVKDSLGRLLASGGRSDGVAGTAAIVKIIP